MHEFVWKLHYVPIWYSKACKHIRNIQSCGSVFVRFVWFVSNEKECDCMKKENRITEVFGTIIKSKTFLFFFALFVVVIMVRTFVVEQILVQGNSMFPALEHEDYILIEKLTYRKEIPRRNDIVVIQVEKTQYVKRIIGLPGECIQIKKGRVYIDGEVLEEADVFQPIEDGGMARNKMTLGEDEYFLLGDNRNHSKDSRNVEIGVVKKKQIKGKLWIRIFPFQHFGTVE